jgi:predicted transcriptional regulator
LVPFAEGFASLADAIESNEEALAKTAVALEDEGEKITELVKQKKVLQGLNEEETKERKKQAENLKDLNDQLDKQIAMLGMSVVEQKVYNALLNGANAEEAEQVRIKAKIVEAYNETTKSLEKLTDEGDKFLESLKSQAEGVGKTRSETLRLQLETLRLSDENHELAESYIAVLKQEEDRIQKLKDQKKATQELIEKGREFRALVDEEQKAIEDRQKAREEANKKRLKAENEALDDIGRAIAEEDAYYQDKAIRQADREQSNIDRRSKERADELEKDRKAAEERERIASDYTDGILMLEDRLMKGKSEKQKLGFRTLVNLSNMERRENAKKIISDSYAAAMGAQKALSGIPIVGPILGAVAAGTIIAGGVTYAANAISGGRALGGQVRDGESYIVGERGPEVLTMGSNGRIIPNDKIGTASGQQVNKVANVTFNINATDASGFDRLLQSRRGQIVSIINQAMNDRGRAAIV